jgi:hypothetical protein
LNQKNNSKSGWFKRRADAYLELSRSLDKVLNTDAAIDNRKKAAADIGKAMQEANYLQKPLLDELLCKLNDEIWNKYEKSMFPDISNFRDLHEVARNFVIIGDERSINFKRLLETYLTRHNSC